MRLPSGQGPTLGRKTGRAILSLFSLRFVGVTAITPNVSVTQSEREVTCPVFLSGSGRFEFHAKTVGKAIDEREVSRYLADVEDGGVIKTGAAQFIHVVNAHRGRRTRQLVDVGKHSVISIVDFGRRVIPA